MKVVTLNFLFFLCLFGNTFTKQRQKIIFTFNPDHFHQESGEESERGDNTSELTDEVVEFLISLFSPPSNE